MLALRSRSVAAPVQTPGAGRPAREKPLDPAARTLSLSTDAPPCEGWLWARHALSQVRKAPCPARSVMVQGCRWGINRSCLSGPTRRPLVFVQDTLSDAAPDPPRCAVVVREPSPAACPGSRGVGVQAISLYDRGVEAFGGADPGARRRHQRGGAPAPRLARRGWGVSPCGVSPPCPRSSSPSAPTTVTAQTAVGPGPSPPGRRRVRRSRGPPGRHARWAPPRT